MAWFEIPFSLALLTALALGAVAAIMPEARRACARAFKWGFGIGMICTFAGMAWAIITIPESNQGPLLGVFVTGPLGFVVGVILGATVGRRRSRRNDGGDDPPELFS